METFDHCRAIAHAIQHQTKPEALAAIDRLLELKRQEQKPAWVRELTKLKRVINEDFPEWAIFTLNGNSKLPFASFSSLPGSTCPGAGSCLDWCYSFRAWRYPAAFCRQAQNAHLMRYGQEWIERDFYALPATVKKLRLYVDGDFASVRDVSFWMSQLTMRSDIAAYGYSKSFNELLAYADLGLGWPKNYLLNLSGGHAHGLDTVAKMKSLPITRGTFDAVSIGRKVKSSDHGTPTINRALFDTVGKGIFPCPGKCGPCKGGDHACGSQKMRGIPIVIAVH